MEGVELYDVGIFASDLEICMIRGLSREEADRPLPWTCDLYSDLREETTICVGVLRGTTWPVAHHFYNTLLRLGASGSPERLVKLLDHEADYKYYAEDRPVSKTFVYQRIEIVTGSSPTYIRISRLPKGGAPGASTPITYWQSNVSTDLYAALHGLLHTELPEDARDAIRELMDQHYKP